MRQVNDSVLKVMSVDELYQFKRDCANNKDIKSLLVITVYQFKHGSDATNVNNIPEMAYYFGRLHDLDSFKSLLDEYSFALWSLPQSCISIAEKLFIIGSKFPILNENEISYLEKLYCDTKTFEIMDRMMFDIELLPRSIKKLDKTLLNRKNNEYSEPFLKQIFECFDKNDKLDQSYDRLYVYSRIKNSVIRKTYEDLGLGEYCIIYYAISDEFHKFIQAKYGENCANFFAQNLCFSENNDWEEFKTSSSYALNLKSIVNVARKYFKNNLDSIEEIKSDLAWMYLQECNSENIE